VIFTSRAGSPVTMLAKASVLVLPGALLAGCMGSPTYGTDKTASEQLLSDMANITSVQAPKGPPIDYKPRPELVRPASTRNLTLPQPQDSIASSSNPDWPESPEQRRARLRAEITANQNDPNYVSPVTSDGVGGEIISKPKPFGTLAKGESGGGRPGSIDYKREREEIQRKLKEKNQGDPTKRRYLSEPPLEYRQSAATAPVDELGEDEVVKDRRAKAAATKKKGGLRRWIPWLD
jgi:hypothetical protein